VTVQSFFGAFTLVPLLVMATEASSVFAAGASYGTFLALLNFGRWPRGYVDGRVVSAHLLTFYSSATSTTLARPLQCWSASGEMLLLCVGSGAN
jgi:hypothetical protein